MHLLSSLAFLLIAFTSIHSRMIDIQKLDSEEESKDWDSLVFTVQWPISTCLIWKEGAGHTCDLPERQAWTVHGIWPTTSGKGPLGPFFCNNTRKFNPDGVKGIRPALIRLWPNIHGQDTEDSLWKHEWDKHGTCAALDPHLSDEHLYFNQGIQWVRDYPMAKILAEKHIVPSMSVGYNVSDIFQAVKDSVGVSPTIACQNDRGTGLTYLTEIRLCFQRHADGFTLIDCKKHALSIGYTSVGDCPSHKLITYPGSDAIKGYNSNEVPKNNLEENLSRKSKIISLLKEIISLL